MEFSPADGAAAKLPAVFSIIEPMGSDSPVWGKTGEEVLSVRIDADQDVPMNRETAVYFQPAMASLFDENGNRL